MASGKWTWRESTGGQNQGDPKTGGQVPVRMTEQDRKSEKTTYKKKEDETSHYVLEEGAGRERTVSALQDTFTLLFLLSNNSYRDEDLSNTPHVTELESEKTWCRTLATDIVSLVTCAPAVQSSLGPSK